MSGEPLVSPSFRTPHALVPLFPQFLKKRRRGFAGLVTILADSGLTRPALFLLLRVAEQPPTGATVEALRPGAPYATCDPQRPWLTEATAAGYLTADVAGRYRLTDRGRALVERMEREATTWLATLQPLPADELTRLAAAFAAIAVGLDVDAGGVDAQVRRSRRIAALVPEAVVAPLVRLERAIFDLWMARDDAHIGAWQNARFYGPHLDVLTHLWHGEVDSLEGLQAALAATQAPDDVSAIVDELLEQGYLEVRHGALQPSRAGYNVREAIESDTDDLYFRQWPDLDPAEIAWLHDALSRLIAALPEAATSV